MKILIVEDEPKLLRNLVNALQKADPLHSIIGSLNALAAQEIIQAQHVDILITDINLPVMSGLDLIAWAREQRLVMEIIVISGYSEFSYAKRAVQYGVIDYLLKPIPEDELIRLIRRIAAERERKQHEKQRSWLKDNASSHDSGETDSTFEAQLFAQQYGQSVYYLLICSLGALPYSILDADLSRSRKIMEDGWENVFKHCQWDKETIWVFENRNASVSCLLALAREDAEPRFHHYLSQLDTWLGIHTDLTVIYSPLILDVHKIKDWHRSLLDTQIKQVALHGRGLLAFVKEQQADKPLSLSSNIYNQAWHAYSKQDYEPFYACWEQIIHYWKDARLLQYQMESELLRFASAATTFPTLAATVDSILVFLYPALRSSLGSAESWADFRQQSLLVLENFVDDHSKADILAARSSHEVIAQEIKAYIEANYAQAITSQTLASKFSYTGTYLSSIFASQFSCSPNEYLLQLRMEQAKHLLLDCPERSINQIAYHVGYSDPLYFSKQFKKAMGKSPSDYRLLHQIP